MGAAAIPYYSVEQYLADDRAAEVKSEYHDGTVFPRADASLAHGLLFAAIGQHLGPRVNDAGCRLAMMVRVRVRPAKFVYPDAIIFWGKPAFTDEHADTLTNPRVIFEILSPSTADFDRGGKFDLYCELPSFEEYVLISQDRQHFETRHRTPEGNWLLKRFDGAEAVLTIASLGISIPLGDIYREIL